MRLSPPRAEPVQAPEWRLALVAGVPVAICLLVMGVPALASPSHALALRSLYFLACALWVPCLVLLQRWLWRRRVGPLATAAALLLATYAMAVVNNGLGALLVARMGWSAGDRFHWANLVSGLDGCWLALIAYCTAHAALAHALSLRDERQRRRAAVLLARQAELRALRYQMQPHFLFNTLNGISTLVGEGRGEQARSMIAQLGDLLRAILENPSHEVALAEELALTETYLAIEQLRLDARLRVQWQVGPGTLEAQVPFLLLQPLAENAIRHGIALRSDPGLLRISAQRRGERLCLQVVNDVPAPGTREPAGQRMGQHNVAERLATLYPGEATFAAGIAGDGTYAVAMELPFRRAAGADA